MLQRLKMDVYRHNLRKFVALVDKCFNAFLEFSNRLKDYWLQQPECEKDTQFFFEEAAIVIEIIKEEVSEGVEDIDLDIFLTAVKFSRGCAIL